jgi:hypothetical protein
MSSVVYECTALMGTNKQGELKPDQDGYYTVVLGALNHFNSKRDFYEFEESRKVFEESSTFMRRVKDGCVYAELDHPRMQPGWTKRDFIARIFDIHQDRVCAHISKVWICNESVKDENGKPITAILGKVKPYGPYGYMVEESFKNKRQNSCFSIRSLTDDLPMSGGGLRKILRHVTNFDFVVEPGIDKAKKWFSPSLETLLDPFRVTKDMIMDFISSKTHQGVAMESDSVKQAKEFVEQMKWVDDKKSPKFLNW